MNQNSSDSSTTLIFKNIPKQIEDITSLLSSLNIPAKEIKPFGRKRALISYELKSEAEHALNILRELEFSGKHANISLFCKEKPKENKLECMKTVTRKLNKSVQTSSGTTPADSIIPQQVSKYVQKLYATEGDLGFDQPPPPYLKYNYPPIDKDILDNICISLLSNKRFYTQVLHLMNRMNLEPPFNKRSYKFTPPGIPKETGTQTEEVITKDPKNKDTIPNQEVEEEIESELETSGEDELIKKRPQFQIKRKLATQEVQLKKKARQMLQTTHKLIKENPKKTLSTNLSINEIFETPECKTAAPVKIELQLKRAPKPVENQQTKKSCLNLPLDLNTQKLNLQQLESLPIYKNYQKGSTSNKLYIKNLQKDVTVEDLSLIYERYIKNTELNLDIKVMQHGRMKGQAFVTFQGGQTELVRAIVAQALEETNGFILNDKPMLVCYGKQS